MSDSNDWMELPSEVLKASHLNFADIMNPVEAGFKIGEAIAGMVKDSSQQHLPVLHLHGPSTGSGGHDAPSNLSKSKTPMPGEATGVDAQGVKAAMEAAHPPVRQASPAHRH